MRLNSDDETIKRNYIQKYRFLIKEYEFVKSKEHPRFRFVQPDTIEYIMSGFSFQSEGDPPYFTA